MKIQTLTAVVGSSACNAKCPYCVSRMTPGCGVAKDLQPVNWRNFRKACRFARDCGVSTLLLTGKGEPTLWPDVIERYLGEIDNDKLDFPFIELQTNGIELTRMKAAYEHKLKSWYDFGMTLISLSVAHFDPERNANIVGVEYNPWDAVEMIHDAGMSVRMNCTLVKGGIDSIENAEYFIEYCKNFGVEQITLREVTKPEISESVEISDWVRDNQVDGFEEKLGRHMLHHGAALLLHLPHGATVFDWHGQNVCLNNCLTSSKDPEKIRQLIFFPDGHLRYSWCYEGAIIL